MPKRPAAQADGLDPDAPTTSPYRLDRDFLLFPINSKAATRRVRLTRDDVVLREFTATLGMPAQWWAHLDVHAWTGEQVRLTIESLKVEGVVAPEDETPNSILLAAVQPSNAVWSADTLYQERWRPQFHFSSRRGWLNDPHVVFYAGEYHLFYQHNPYSTSWGNGHWGHAVSTDLVHWTELPIAIYPDEGCIMQSGTIVVDWANRAGFQVGDEPALIASYTTRGRLVYDVESKLHRENDILPTQGIAFSNDRGRTWTKYEGNPVLPYMTNEARDPNIFWYQPDQKWVMALYMGVHDIAVRDHYFWLFSSRDLTAWEKMSEITNLEDWECPELFELPIDEDATNTRWIFYGAYGRYLIGTFDGSTFTPESGPHQLQHGDCWYASQRFRDIPSADGRCLVIPWGRAWDWGQAWDAGLYPEMPFNQAMGLPLELTLRSTEDGLRIFSNPAAELVSLRSTGHTTGPHALPNGDRHSIDVGTDLYEVDVELTLGDATEIVIELSGVPITYSVEQQELCCAESRGPLPAGDGRLRLRILVDRTTIDIFGDDGRLYMPMGIRMTADKHSVAIQAKGDDGHIESLRVFELESAWNR